jgi:histidinol-phosphate phosphatase family protein
VSAARIDVVVPTAGRESLVRLLDALERAHGPRPRRILVVRDGPGRGPARTARPGVEVLRTRGGGPAAARNAGWRAARGEWVAFVDDDVVPDPDWLARLAEDVDGLPADVAGSQGRLRVPLPADRAPTDWERNVSGLATARWATADMCFRRSALAAVGGFDERFPRAFREDADLALRLRRAGYRLVRGRRTAAHPVRPAGPLASVRAQAGNADDALMRALHGRSWRQHADVPRGRRPAHLATTASAALAAAARAARRPSVAAITAAGWLAGTAELAWRRIAPGPRTGREVATVALTSVLIPPAASWHWLAGLVRAGRLVRGRPEFVAESHEFDETSVHGLRARSELVALSHKPSRLRERPLRRRSTEFVAESHKLPPEAVLVDRDGTIVVDVPHNGEPGRVRPMPGAARALARVRAAGIRVGVVSNQGGVGRGLLTRAQVDAVNRRVDELLGPFEYWAVCLHAEDDGCECRKPAPGLIRRAARELGVAPARCAVIGDIGADVEAARAAGARAILVPTAATRPEEVAAAPEIAATLEEAVDRLLGASP